MGWGRDPSHCVLERCITERLLRARAVHLPIAGGLEMNRICRSAMCASLLLVVVVVCACSGGALSNAAPLPRGADGGQSSLVPEICGDGIDNDGDGTVDNGCSCDMGASRPCYLERGGDVSPAGVQRCEGA